MKTKLPNTIESVEEAKSFLTELYNNGEGFNPEDGALNIEFEYNDNTAKPTWSECLQLDRLMDMCELYLDTCEFLLELFNNELFGEENEIIKEHYDN